MDFSLPRTIKTLERTPLLLPILLAGMDEELTQANYGPGTWSAYEVVGHLIIGEQTDWIHRARIILEHGPTRRFDPFPHDAAIHPSCGRPLEDLLDEFAALRATNLEALRRMQISPDKLALTGTHPALGQVTLAQLLAAWATHDLHHIRQICRALAYQSRNLVGPWRDYLNTLTGSQ